jgi:hypothetical protein
MTIDDIIAWLNEEISTVKKYPYWMQFERTITLNMLKKIKRHIINNTKQTEEK